MPLSREVPPLLRVLHSCSPKRETSWNQVQESCVTFQGAQGPERFVQLGHLFQHLAPWIERGVRQVMMRHFLVLPTELIVARLFGLAARRDRLHLSSEAFLFWVESQILRDLSDPEDDLGTVNGAVGEPSSRLQQRFNTLPVAERALLHLFLVENQSFSQVSELTGIPLDQVEERMHAVWEETCGDLANWELPRGWQLPSAKTKGATKQDF